MTSLPAILLIVLSLALLALGRGRSAIEARPRGVILFRALQAAVLLASVALLCWQMFAIGFQMCGDIARRDARAEARAAARA